MIQLPCSGNMSSHLTNAQKTDILQQHTVCMW